MPIRRKGWCVAERPAAKHTGIVAASEGEHRLGMDRDYDEILTSREAQKLLRIGRTKLWALTKNGHLPAYRIGDGKTSALRYKRVELMKWLEKNRIVLKRD